MTFRRCLILFFGALLSSFTLPGLGSIDTNHISRLTRSSYYVENYYYDPARIQPEKMLRAGLMDVARLIPEVLIDFPEGKTDSFIVWYSNQSITIKLPPLKKLSDIFVPVSQTFDFIFKYMSTDTKPDDVETAFITGMLTKLDPHSDFMTPDMFKEFKTQTEGEYGGLGIVIGMKDEELTVIAPIDGTPAMEAGIKAEDKIIQIDDAATINMSLSEAVERLRGTVGSKVTLYIRRKGSDNLEFPMIRRKIIIQSVKSKLSTIGDKKIGILHITGFQEDTYSDMIQALDKLQKSAGGRLDGLIFDLRNNPGGLLDQSLKMADKFLESGDMLFTVGANEGDESVVKASSQPTDLKIPMIVLINEGSASASEIVSGAMKGNNRALIVGARSFGKGSVQSLFSLKDGSSLKLTVAQYLTPGRVSIQAEGIVPDIDLHAVHIGDDDMDLLEDTRFGEKDLEEHLTSSQTVKGQRPAYIIPYFEEEKPKEESEYTSQINDKSDFPIVFSLGLMNQNPMNQRQAWVKTLDAQVKEASEKQASNIKAALEKRGIDWSSASVSGNPHLEATSTLLDTTANQSTQQLVAGHDVNWTIKVSNSGDDVTHLIGVVASEHPLLRDREFVFGKIARGSSKEVTVKIKVPKESVNFDEIVTLNFFTQSHQQLKPVNFGVKIVEAPKPLLSFQYELFENGQLGSIGNNNGRPDKGETIALKVTIFNKGDHNADDVSLNLKNLEEEDGIFLKEGRATLKTINAQSQKDGTLLFRVEKSFPNDSLKLKLSILEKNTRTHLESILRYGLDQAKGQIDPAPKTQLIPPTLGLVRQELSSDHKTLRLSGWAQDEDSLTDIMIFANGDKLFYRTPPSETALAGTLKSPSKIPFEATLPLKEGANIINIMARDNQHIASEIDLLVDGPARKDIENREDVIVP